MKINKKLLIAFFVVILFVLALRNINTKKLVQQVNSPTNNEAKIDINGVAVNDFFKFSVYVKEGEYAQVISTDSYQVYYFNDNNQFLVSIINRPFDEKRKIAEEELLQILGTDQIEACKLDIVITTPGYANPEFAGKNYKLSFCE